MNKPKSFLKELFLPKLPKRKGWAVLVFFSIILFLISLSCLAKTEFTPTQKETLTKSYGLTGSQITNLEDKDITFKIFYNNYNYQISKGKSGEEAAKATYGLLVSTALEESALQGAPEAYYAAKSQGENWAVSAFFAPIIAALYLIATFLKHFVGFAGNVLDLTLNPSLYNFTGNKMIIIGWSAVRDICNLFFLLVLLFIAFCTILQIPKYHARKTLLMLIIMALLINFSKPIAVFIFDGSQLLMNFFLSKMGAGGNQDPSTMYNRATEIANIVYNNVERWVNSESSPSLAIQYLFAIVFLFMLMVAYLVIAIFLVIRIVAIMVLIIVSPFAFFASVIPDLNKMSSSWWDALFKYSYFGPAAAFFLYLATGLASHLPEITKGVKQGSSLAVLTHNMIHYLVTIVFLYASIIMANKFSLQFSQAVTGYADRALKWTAGMVSGYRAGRWAVRKTGEGIRYATKAGLKMAERKWLMPYGLSPRARWEGWKQRTEEIDREALERATGASRDQYHKWLDKAHTNYEQLAVDRQKTKKMKEYSEQSEDFKFLGAQLSGLVGSKATDAKEKMCGIFRIAWKNKDQDELLGYIKNKLIEEEKLPEDQRVFSKLGFTKENTRVNAKNANDAATRLLGSAGGNNKYINRELLDLGVIAASNGGIGFGATRYNEATKEFERVEPLGEVVENQGQEAYSAIRKLLTSGEAQQIPKFFHRNHFTDEGDEEGNNRIFNEEGKQALWLYASNVAAIEHSGRFRPDFYRQVGADTEISDQMYSYISDMYGGEAMGYDAETKKYGKLKADKHKATLATAWLSAVQARSGVDIKDIKASVARVAERNNIKFEDLWNDIKKYQKTAKVELEKSEAKERAPETEPETSSPETMETDAD